MEATYSRLGVYVHAPWRVVVRAARSRIAKQHRHDPALKQARKRFYSEILACHARHQHLVRTFRL
jgi:hypothetical protein